MKFPVAVDHPECGEETGDRGVRRTILKKTLAVLLIIFILIAVLWDASFIIGYFLRDLFSNPSYTKIIVPKGETVTIEFGENEYNFTCSSLSVGFNNSTRKIFWIETSNFQTTYFAIEDKVYRVSKLEVVVSEVHPNFIVLLAREK